MPTPLYYSSLCGFSDLVEHLAIKHPQHVDAIGGWYEFPLVAALSGNHIKVAEILLNHGANVDIRGTGGGTPLHELIEDVRVVQFLLNNGADANCRRRDNLRTPLHLALPFEKGRGVARLGVARVLLQHGADANVKDNRGETPLHQLFVNYGSDDYFLDLARLLLEHGTDVNARNHNHMTPLHLAIISERYKCARILLEHGADASAQDFMGQTPLHLTFRSKRYPSNNEGDFLDLTRFLLEKGADVNRRNNDNKTPLHLAINSGMFKCVKVLLEHGADPGDILLSLLIDHGWFGDDDDLALARLLLEHGADANIRTTDESTLLHHVALYGYFELARVLLDYGANVNTVNKHGTTPLHEVSRGEHDVGAGRVGIVRLLLERGASVNASDKGHDTTLHLAAFWGRLEIAQVLLQCGANPNAKNKWGETPLHIMSRGKYDSQEHGVGIARLLLEHGTDVHAQDENHDTALHSAAYWGRLELAQVLLKCGATPNAKNKWGETPLHILSRGKYDSQEHGVGIARLLLEHGTDVHARDEDHDTALHLAAYWGRPEFAQVLLECGTSPNTKNKWGETPLHVLSRGEYKSQEHGVSIARLLLEHGTDVHTRDEDHGTTLHSAAFGGRLGLAQVLLQCGANPNAKNKWGETPLHLLSRGKYYPQEHGVGIARLLLERGADVNALDKDQFTPFYFASYFRRFDIAQLLFEYGLKDGEPSQGTKRKADDVTVGSRSEKTPKLHEDAPRAMGTRTPHQP
ncbi:ankyrin repeat-containing domain protein [Lactarius akahatsu]|uniref:Ankyrin repeat-containing domain protein n=1 Tax=Lactarius akahatsu TaxID=416441 RepID=A0AAD4LFA1_9AGAM|nr:ankyrin repeat-containing domain protein [Lactarius akahatsu]